MNTPDPQAFQLGDIVEQQRQSRQRWLEFFQVPSSSMGIYQVRAGTTDQDDHAPHEEDEIYLVVEGRGQLRAGEREFALQQGSLIFVPAKMSHYFHDVAEDLTLLVFFARSV